MKKPKLSPRRVRRTVNGLYFDFTLPFESTSDIGVSLVKNDQYSIIFSEPLEKLYGSSSYVTITDSKTMRCDTRLVILPKTDDFVFENNRFDFVTHWCQMDDNQRIKEMGIQLINGQIRGDTDIAIWQPLFRLRIGKGIGSENVFSRWNLSNSLVSRNLPNGLTTSRFAKYLGYYRQESKPSPWMSAAMRYGQIMEDPAKLLYLTNHPDSIISDVIPNDFCIPDAFVGSDGILSIKASQNNCIFESSYIIQVVGEMLVYDRKWSDIVKFCKKGPQCKEIRVHRDSTKEDGILRLVIQAFQSREPAKLWDTPPFVEARAYFDGLAKLANENAQDLQIPANFVESIESYKEELLKNQDTEVLIKDPLMDRIEKRQNRIFAHYFDNKLDELRRELAEQIQDYAELGK